MPVPRRPEPLPLRILMGILAVLVLPIILVYMFAWMFLYLAYSILTLPWLCFFPYAHSGLPPQDIQSTQIIAEQIQSSNTNVQTMISYIRPPIPKYNGFVGRSIEFYPNKVTKNEYVGVAFVNGSRETEHTFLGLSQVFAALESAGWKRRDIYTLFEEMTNDSESRRVIREVKERVCRGKIPSGNRLLDSGMPRELAARWTFRPVDMWKANRAVIDVDMTDTRWILTPHALLRPRDTKTLRALDKLDGSLQMFKFVTKEEDLMEDQWWQYVVM